jgi:hypothetical protein
MRQEPIKACRFQATLLWCDKDSSIDTTVFDTNVGASKRYLKNFLEILDDIFRASEEQYSASEFSPLYLKGLWCCIKNSCRQKLARELKVYALGYIQDVHPV